jgi:hypothetical protein
MIHKLIYPCEQAAKLSSQAMEQPLTPAQRLRLRLHLMMCEGCTGFTRQIDFLRRASRKIPQVLEEDAD